MALSSIFLIFVILLLLLSSLLKSCLFLGCMFLSLLIFICHLSFSSLCFFSLVCCSHPCCLLLMYSHFVFAAIVPTFPSSELSFSYIVFFFFLSLFFLFLLLSIYYANMTPPQKNTKTSFCSYWQNRAGFRREFHQSQIFWENVALCCRVQTNFWIILI